MRKPQISLLYGLYAPNKNRTLPISSLYIKTCKLKLPTTCRPRCFIYGGAKCVGMEVYYEGEGTDAFVVTEDGWKQVECTPFIGGEYDYSGY